MFLRIYDEIMLAMRGAKWDVKELVVPVQYLSLDMDVVVDAAGRTVKVTLCQRNAIDTFIAKLSLESIAPASVGMSHGCQMGPRHLC